MSLINIKNLFIVGYCGITKTDQVCLSIIYESWEIKIISKPVLLEKLSGKNFFVLNIKNTFYMIRLISYTRGKHFNNSLSINVLFSLNNN